MMYEIKTKKKAEPFERDRQKREEHLWELLCLKLKVGCNIMASPPSSRPFAAILVGAVQRSSRMSFLCLWACRFDECVEGGDSQLVDAWYEAQRLRHSHPKHFDTLTTVPATFQKVHFDR